jgi:hypothetical protein
MTEALRDRLGRSVGASGMVSFFVGSPPFRASLLCTPLLRAAVRLDAELFRRRDSRYGFLTDGVGLGGFDASAGFGWGCSDARRGFLGGGMASWRVDGSGSEVALVCGCGGIETLGFDVFRFHDKLSLRRSELIDEGVGGSSGLDRGLGGDATTRRTVLAASAEGTRLFAWLSSCSGKPSPMGLMVSWSVWARLINAEGVSAVVLGTDDDTNGEKLDLRARSVDDVARLLVSNDAAVAPSIMEGVSNRGWWIELLLRGWRSSLSSRCREKKVLLEAVMGVVGVLLPRTGGGVSSRSVPCRFNSSILAVVAALRGARLMGGSFRGWRFFRDCGLSLSLDVAGT